MAMLTRFVLIAPLLVMGAMSCANAENFQYRVKLATPAKTSAFTPIGSGGTGAGTLPTSSDPAPGTPGSTTPTSPTTPVPPNTPRAELSASAIDFGAQATHTSVMAQVVLTNSGTAPLHLAGGPTLKGVSAFGLGLTNCGAALAVNQSCHVEVVYAPEIVANDAGLLEFASDAANAPVTVALRGAGYNPVSLAKTGMLKVGMTSEFSFDLKSLLTVTNEASPDKVMASWTIVQGELPPGVSLSNVGVIRGTATSIFSTTLTIRVTYRSNVAVQSYSMRAGSQCYLEKFCNIQNGAPSEPPPPEV